MGSERVWLAPEMRADFLKSCGQQSRSVEKEEKTDGSGWKGKLKSGRGIGCVFWEERLWLRSWAQTSMMPLRASGCQPVQRLCLPHPCHTPVAYVCSVSETSSE